MDDFMLSKWKIGTKLEDKFNIMDKKVFYVILKRVCTQEDIMRCLLGKQFSIWNQRTSLSCTCAERIFFKWNANLVVTFAPLYVG